MSEKLTPVLVHLADVGWESWEPADRAVRGDITWKTLLSADRTPTSALTVGLARLHPGQFLAPHRHTQAEIYYLLHGVGEMYIEGTTYAVKPGTAIFIPGNAEHGIANKGSEPVEFLYAFATDSFQEIVYRFADEGKDLA